MSDLQKLLNLFQETFSDFFAKKPDPQVSGVQRLISALIERPTAYEDNLERHIIMVTKELDQVDTSDPKGQAKRDTLSQQIHIAAKAARIACARTLLSRLEKGNEVYNKIPGSWLIGHCERAISERVESIGRLLEKADVDAAALDLGEEATCEEMEEYLVETANAARIASAQAVLRHLETSNGADLSEERIVQATEDIVGLLQNAGRDAAALDLEGSATSEQMEHVVAHTANIARLSRASYLLRFLEEPDVLLLDAFINPYDNQYRYNYPVDNMLLWGAPDIQDLMRKADFDLTELDATGNSTTQDMRTRIRKASMTAHHKSSQHHHTYNPDEAYARKIAAEAAAARDASSHEPVAATFRGWPRQAPGPA